jgi:RNA 3'-terminal phosphate cyclase (ATP)
LYRVGAETTTGCLLAASALGKRGVPASDVGTQATEDLLSDLSCQPCVDRHLQDQVCVVLIPNKKKELIDFNYS